MLTIRLFFALYMIPGIPDPLIVEGYPLFMWGTSTIGSTISPKDELEIFTELFENAVKNQKKIHIV